MPLQHHSYRPRSFPAWLSVVVVLGLLLGSEADAARRIVYLGFSGVRGQEVTQMVARFLTGRFELVSRARYAQEARRRHANLGTASGRSIGARAVKAVAVVSGTVTGRGGGFVLRATVYSASNGAAVGNISLPLHGMRIDPLTARRVVNGLLPALARATPGAPLSPTAVARGTRGERRPARGGGEEDEPVALRSSPTQRPAQPAEPKSNAGRFNSGRKSLSSREPDNADGDESDQGDEDESTAAPQHRPQPRPPVASTDEGDEGSSGLGFDDGSGNDKRQSRGDAGSSTGRSGRRRGTDTSAEVHKPAGAREDWEKIVEFSLGMMFVGRSFNINDPIKPATPANYDLKMVPAIMTDLGLYPLAFLGHGPFAGLGVVFSYFRVPVLRSKVDDVDTDTTLQGWELGLRYRWNILGRLTSPTLRAGVSIGQHGFEIHYSETRSEIPLPNVSYLYLKLAAGQLEVPFYALRNFTVGGLLSFDYLVVFNSGAIERTDTNGYGPSTTGGIEIGGGLYATYGNFFVRATGFYRRMFFAFDGACYDPNSISSCKAAGGALDIYQGLTVLGGYAY